MKGWRQPIVGTWQIGDGADMLEITRAGAGWLLRLPSGDFRRLEGVAADNDAGARRAAARYVLAQGRRLVRLGEAALEDPS